MNIIDKMREKIMDIINPDVEYSQEDFDNEFSNMNTVDNAFKLNIKFANKSNNYNPRYETNGSAGFDLRANLDSDIVIPAKGGIAIIRTGLYFELPSNFEMQIRPRSGLAAKHGVTVLNSPGTIDSDYRGEIQVILINHGDFYFTVAHGDRIAQAVVASVINHNIFNFIQVNEISDDTERSSGGFGSTGMQ